MSVQNEGSFIKDTPINNRHFSRSNLCSSTGNIENRAKDLTDKNVSLSSKPDFFAARGSLSSVKKKQFNIHPIDITALLKGLDEVDENDEDAKDNVKIPNEESFITSTKNNLCIKKIEEQLKENIEPNSKKTVETLNIAKNNSNVHILDDKIADVKPKKVEDSFELDFSVLSLHTPNKKETKVNETHNVQEMVQHKFITPKCNPTKIHFSAKKEICFNSVNKLNNIQVSKNDAYKENHKKNNEIDVLPSIVEKQNNIITVKDVEYKILSKIGKGGSSEVFHCYNLKNGMNCAIKCVFLNDPSTAQGYINEVDILRKLQNCEKIIKMENYEYLKEDKKLLVVLEKGGEDLSTILKHLALNKSHVSMHTLLFYWMEMLYAVREIHTHGIIHSDLKPANFIQAGGGIKLIDFGIARCVQMDMTSVIKTNPEGSCNYISPEAIKNESSSNVNSPSYGKNKYKINYKSDVWSLGCILYQLVYRKTPFQHITQMWPKLFEIANPNHRIEYPEAPWVSRNIINTIKKCLQFEKRNRPTVDELILEYESSLLHLV